MRTSRRSFLTGAAATSLAFGIPIGPIKARVLRGTASASSSFNGGKSQVNFNAVQSGSGEFPFMNVMKTANINSILTPDNCDTNGCPTTGGGGWATSIPSQNERSGSYYLRWVGTGVASIGMTGGITINSGSLTPSAGVGFCEFTPVSSTSGPSANAVTVGFNNPAQSITLCHHSDDAAVQANPNEFHPQFMAVMRALNPGVLRFFNWFAGDISSVTTWASRAPTTYVSFAGTPLEKNNYGGFGILSGTDISVSTPPGGFALQDKARLQYFVGTTMPLIVNNGGVAIFTSGSPNVTMLAVQKSETAAIVGGATNVAWSNHGLSANEQLVFTATPPAISGLSSFTVYFAGIVDANTITIAATSGGTPITFGGSGGTVPLSAVGPHGLSSTNQIYLGGASFPSPFTGVSGSVIGGATATPPTTYFVTVIDIDTVTLSATSGGSSISPTSNGGCSSFGFVTMSVGGGSKIPVFNGNFYTYPMGFINYSSANASFSMRVLVYDATFGAFCDLFSTSGGSSVPPEVCLDLCYKLGAHPWFCIPPLACDPATDLLPQLGALIQSTYQNGKAPWMIPRFETPNECWNNTLPGGDLQYANRKASYYGWAGAYNDWVGKVGSILGQACANVWGYGNRGTKYFSIIGVQTTTGTDQNFGTGASRARFNSTAFINSDPNPLQSPYTRTPAFVWCSHLCAANYVVPSDNTELGVVTKGYAYSVTNVGNPTAQLQNVADYVDTLGGAALHFNSAAVIGYFTNWVAFGQGVTQSQTTWTFNAVNYTFGVTCYEGGYSPDYGGGGVASPITGATVTSSTTVNLTLATTSVQGNTARTGNPAIVGMFLKIASVGGMTQLNGNTYAVANVSGNTVTITIPSTTGFGTYTSGGSASYFQDSGATISADVWIQNMRGQGKLCTTSTAKPANGLGGWITDLYNGLTAAGAVFPSCFVLGDVPPPPGNDVWSILDDVYQCGSPPVFSSGKPSPQALAIQTYN